MSGLYDNNGRILYTEVDGNSFVGIYNPNRTYNAVNVTDSEEFVGIYHSSGAFNITLNPEATVILNKNGSINVVYNGDGTYSPVTSNRIIIGPFDSIASSLYSACGFQRLLSEYTGSCVRVRRSSDNSEEDIGFTNYGSLDTESLLSFTGSGNSAYIVTIYDQTSNGHNLIQTTTGNQPRLVNAGSVEIVDGVISSSLTGTQRLIVEDSLDFSRNVSGVSVAFLASITNLPSSPYLFMSSTPTEGTRVFMSAPSTAVLNFGGRRLDNNGAQAVSRAFTGTYSRLIGRLRYSEALADVTIDGETTEASFQTSGLSSNTDSSDNSSVFSYIDGSARSTGFLSCCVLAQSALSISDLEASLQKVAIGFI